MGMFIDFKTPRRLSFAFVAAVRYLDLRTGGVFGVRRHLTKRNENPMRGALYVRVSIRDKDQNPQPQLLRLSDCVKGHPDWVGYP